MVGAFNFNPITFLNIIIYNDLNLFLNRPANSFSSASSGFNNGLNGFGSGVNSFGTSGFNNGLNGFGSGVNSFGTSGFNNGFNGFGNSGFNNAGLTGFGNSGFNSFGGLNPSSLLSGGQFIPTQFGGNVFGIYLSLSIQSEVLLVIPKC